jgi:hypothetical protein
MPHYFSNIDGDHPFRDEPGEQLENDAAAWVEALRLSRDIEGKITPGQRWRLYVIETGEPVFLNCISTSFLTPALLSRHQRPLRWRSRNAPRTE